MFSIILSCLLINLINEVRERGTRIVIKAWGLWEGKIHIRGIGEIHRDGINRIIIYKGIKHQDCSWGSKIHFCKHSKNWFLC